MKYKKSILREILHKGRNTFLTVLLLTLGVLHSCDGQTPRPNGNMPNTIPIDSTPAGGWVFDFPKDTVYIDVPFEVTVHDTTYVDIIVRDTTYVDVPYAVHDTTYVDVIVEVPFEVIKEVHDTTYVDVEVIKEIIKEVERGIEIDTLYTQSDVILLDYTDSLIKPTDEAAVYALVAAIGLVEIEMDTVYSWQRNFALERTQSYGEATYRSFELPFQMRNYEYINITDTTCQVRIWATEQCMISYYLNSGAEHPASSTGFNASKQGEIEYRHTRTLDGLTPNTNYTLQIKVETVDGRVAFSEGLSFTTK